jgi:hypothetical protein
VDVERAIEFLLQQQAAYQARADAHQAQFHAEIGKINETLRGVAK